MNSVFCFFGQILITMEAMDCQDPLLSSLIISVYKIDFKKMRNLILIHYQCNYFYTVN